MIIFVTHIDLVNFHHFWPSFSEAFTSNNVEKWSKFELLVSCSSDLGSGLKTGKNEEEVLLPISQETRAVVQERNFW